MIAAAARSPAGGAGPSPMRAPLADATQRPLCISSPDRQDTTTLFTPAKRFAIVRCGEAKNKQMEGGVRIIGVWRSSVRRLLGELLMTIMSIRGVPLFVKVVGRGYPLVIMHGGPGADHTSLMSLRPCADQFTLIFYDHRCNGRSMGANISSFTWENLAADADALRQALGFEEWGVLGHSLGGMVALEYALRYPEHLSHLVLLDTCGDLRWAQEKAPELLAQRGYSQDTVKLARRFLNGQIAPNEMMPALMKLASAYYPHKLSPLRLVQLLASGLGSKTRPEALIFGYGHSLRGWTVMDRLGEIKVRTLVMAGRDDFQFPPEHQAELVAGIAGARLEIIERAGHNAHQERPAEVIKAVKDFMAAGTPSRS